MPAIMFVIFITLAGVMLVNKFSGPPRSGEPAETAVIRQAVWRVLKFVALFVLISALLFVARMFLMSLK